MSKNHSGTSKDIEEKPTKFEILVQVCRIARELRDEEKLQQVQGIEQNNIATSSLHSSVFKDELWKRSCKTIREELSSSSRVCKFDGKRCVDDHDYLNDKEGPSRVCKYNGKRCDDDHDYLNGKEGTSRVCKYNGKRCDDDHDYLNHKEVILGHKGKKINYYDGENYECSEKKEKKKIWKDIMAKNKVIKITPLPLEFKNLIQEMGGDDVKLVIQKHMFAADTDTGQNRFSIPVKQIREDAKGFLTENEVQSVPFEVPLIEPNLNLTQIVIRNWNSSSKSSPYMLSGLWSVIRDRNNLQVGMEMQLWSFRVDGELNLALVKVSRDNERVHDINDIENTIQTNIESHDQQRRDAAPSSSNQLNEID